jgi:hypothetical protein
MLENRLTAWPWQLLFGGWVAVAGCTNLDVADLNAPSLDSLVQAPTRESFTRFAPGLVYGARNGVADARGYISFLGILGREGYNLDPSEPRLVTELLEGPITPGGIGINVLWAPPYANIRSANILLAIVDRVPGLTSEEKEATIGFAQTLQANDFLRVINLTDVFGAPVDVGSDPRDPPSPIRSKDEVFRHIASLLDSAATHLAAGGSAFPFPLTPGFAGFDAPASFVRFNRALRARVAVYTGAFAVALAALDQSFLDRSAPLTLGIYHTYSTAAGDVANGLFDPTSQFIRAHLSLAADARLRADGTPDLRLQTKVVQAPPLTVQGITSEFAFAIYPTAATPVPIIRNEELILLRAEANLGLGDLGAALDDLNFIRVNSGGLPPYAGPVTHDALLDELLYNKRYSLLLEGGHRWIDLRRYGRLTDLPLDLPSHRRFDKFPFPKIDCDAYVPPPSQGCAPVVGF